MKEMILGSILTVLAFQWSTWKVDLSQALLQRTMGIIFRWVLFHDFVLWGVRGVVWMAHEVWVPTFWAEQIWIEKIWQWLWQ